jgi:hypothetical protein
MKYDDASWHSGWNFPAGSPPEYGATHIALFLRWCFSKGWVGEIHRSAELEDTQRVVEGKLSAVEYFFKYCDGKLKNEDFDDTGNAFAEKYYGDDGLYLQDFAEQFGDLMYVAPESAHDYSKFSSMLARRLETGILTKQQQKPWWKLW